MNNNKNNISNFSYSFVAFYILVFLIVIDGIIKEFYIWADPLAEAMVLLYFPIIIIAHGKRELQSKKSIFFAVILLIIAGIAIWATILIYLHNGYFLIKNGKLANSSCLFLVGLLFIYEAILMLIKSFKVSST